MYDSHNGPEIGENVKRPKRVEVVESSVFEFLSGRATAADSCGTDQGHGLIRIFPDSVLLAIFDLYRTDRENHYSNQPASIFEWRLAHVCQRWRYLIFALPPPRSGTSLLSRNARQEEPWLLAGLSYCH